MVDRPFKERRPFGPFFEILESKNTERVTLRMNNELKAWVDEVEVINTSEAIRRYLAFIVTENRNGTLKVSDIQFNNTTIDSSTGNSRINLQINEELDDGISNIGMINKSSLIRGYLAKMATLHKEGKLTTTMMQSPNLILR